MPRTWGSWSATSTSGARYRVGLDWSRSGTRVTVSQYVFESAFSIRKGVTLRRTGSLSGTYSEYVGTSGGVVSLGRGGSATGSRGGSVVVGGSVTNILHGLTCSVSVRVSIPALPPSTVGRPNRNVQGSDRVYVSWLQPSTNGSAIDRYHVRVERGGSLVQGTNTGGNDRNHTFTRLDANTRFGVRVRARNSAGWGGWSSFGYFTTDMVRPNTQTNLSANRVNDNRVTLSWTRRSTSGGPYSRQRIRRRVNGGTWQNLAAVSAGATSYTDNTTGYSNRYEYAIRAENSAGNSSFAYSNQVYMRPRGPVGTITAQKTSSNNIRVSWPASSSDYTAGYRIYGSADGGSFSLLGSTSSTSWTHLDPDPSVTHTYQISATRGSLEGNRSLSSNTVQLQAPPLAPTLLDPGDGETLSNVEDVTFSWRHNPVDTTDQTEYELAYRIDGGEVTVLSGTTAQSRTIPALEYSAEITWNVRTRGDDPAFGPWVAANTFSLASIPVAVITSPSEDDLNAAHVSVEWEYSNDDAADQVMWQVELLSEGSLIEQNADSTVGSTFTFDARLEDATEYTIRVRVRASTGMWSDWDSVVFTTDFPLPVTITPELEWDRSVGAVMVTLATEELESFAHDWTGEPGSSTSTREGLSGSLTNLITNPRGRTTPGTVVVRSDVPVDEAMLYDDPTTSPDTDLSVVWAGVPGESVADLTAPAPVGFSAFSGSVVYYSTTHDAVAVYRPTTISSAATTVLTATAGDSGTLVVDYLDISGSPQFIRVSGAVSDGRIFQGSAEPGEWTAFHLGFNATGGDVTLEAQNRSGAGSTVYTRWAVIDGTDAYEGPWWDGDTPDQAVPDAVDVERRDAGGEWVMIGSGLDPYTSIIDPTPRLGEVEYRVVSRTALPSESVGPVVMIEWDRRRSDPSVFVSGGEAMEVVCTAQGGSRSNTPAIEQSSVRFAGQSRPTAVFGAGEEHEVAFTGKIVHTSDHSLSLREDWEELLRQFSIVCYRDALGVKVYGLLSVEFSLDGVVEQVSLRVQQMRYIEGVERVADADLDIGGEDE